MSCEFFFASDLSKNVDLNLINKISVSNLNEFDFFSTNFVLRQNQYVKTT